MKAKRKAKAKAVRAVVAVVKAEVKEPRKDRGRLGRFIDRMNRDFDLTNI